ncbi:DUF924 domain-containing protein [Shewanella sp. Actino-trap-3]|jgi:uncharacterized protein (DUF924 family)|uniref:DUF924 family protein n=1 Tax=Shewanella sp. Actino-trap-3 TaxID=2058331 RepID=UPI000C346C99|nr:DUF924 family protein [Shewanella sp. Actino-trap-3]PKG78443.1 DUF924 domain-containing protein [Shewanella sp. Actino-trap-3]
MNEIKTTRVTVNDVIDFWFVKISPKQWWIKDTELDLQITKTFGTALNAAIMGELQHWRKDTQGRLAEIIVLDQFSRNIHRDTPAAFAADNIALVLAQEAVALGCLAELPTHQAGFLIMPYMHSESMIIHQQALPLFEQYAPNNLHSQRQHQAIIAQFNRYPHRNAILGRDSTAAEIIFLNQPDSSF